MLVETYQYKTYENINIINLNILLSDLSWTKVEVYFSKHCTAICHWCS